MVQTAETGKGDDLGELGRLLGDGQARPCPGLGRGARSPARRRGGFFAPEQFQAVLAQLPEDLKAVAECGYITGWRVDSEITTRQWAHVDVENGSLRLDPGETKNGGGRSFPFTPEL